MPLNETLTLDISEASEAVAGLEAQIDRLLDKLREIVALAKEAQNGVRL